MEANTEERLENERRQRALQGVITLNRLMSVKLEEARSKNKDLVYLDIAVLHAKEVFVSVVEIFLCNGIGPSQFSLY